ncbi:hypothetical protein DSL92_01755 [Billgrantia gudaonensis]|uniref:Uncharacterized protein n=1 Tax=Billgrantia gudaonensis TaxID=376427 RepID=A0A432JKE3_9GAMM|nr:hypothetical protein DSL92_01755 [Halomonas gudaonensis]
MHPSLWSMTGENSLRQRDDLVVLDVRSNGIDDGVRRRARAAHPANRYAETPTTAGAKSATASLA